MKDSQEWFFQGNDRSHQPWSKQTNKKANQKTEENFGDKNVLGKRKSKFYKGEVMLDHRLISCTISTYSAAWSEPVSQLISTCQPLIHIKNTKKTPKDVMMAQLNSPASTRTTVWVRLRHLNWSYSTSAFRWTPAWLFILHQWISRRIRTEEAG